MNRIKFYDHEVKSRLTDKLEFAKFLELLFSKEGFSVNSVSIIFSTDEYLLTLNKEFLNHNYYTDTLTFLLAEDEKAVSGEIYISTDRVLDNSKELKEDFQKEIKRVIIHSCLHLCGYSDKGKERLKLEKKQEFYLEQWYVSRETNKSGST